MAIDYEKLKKCHDLIKKLDSGTLHHTYSNDDSNNFSFNYCGNKAVRIESFTDLDSLLQQLQSLTKPKPKFEVGDTVWGLYNNKPISFQIMDYNLPYQYENGFATKSQLIQHQIDYWQSLKEESEPKECQHESDGEKYFTKVPPDWKTPPEYHSGEYQCTKCGAFYKEQPCS